MKNIKNDRDGQISLGLIAVVVGGILISVMAGVAIKGGTNAINSAKVSQQKAAGCSELNPEQCAADELAKNLAAEEAKKAAENPIVGADEQLKDAVAAPSCADGDIDCQLQREARSTGGFLDSQKELGSNWIYGPILFMEAVFESAKKSISNFWNPPSEPIAPIDLDSVPSSPSPDQAPVVDSTVQAPVSAVNPSVAEPTTVPKTTSGGGSAESPEPKPVTTSGGSATKLSCFASVSFKNLVTTYDTQVSTYKALNTKLDKFTVITDSNRAEYYQLAADTSAARGKAMDTIWELEAAYEKALANSDNNLCVADSDTKLCAEAYMMDLEIVGIEDMNKTAGACFQ